MNAIFMSSKNSKTSDPHRLLLNLIDKTEKRSENVLLYQILAYTIHGKYEKVIYLNYLLDHILYHMFKIILNIS